MQPYRTAKPHRGTDTACPQCTPAGPGHELCQNEGCDAIKTTQTRRHATDAEYAAIPAGLAPIDGIAHQAVYGCDDCADEGGFDPICTPQAHQAPPVPCPKCGANGEQPCVKKDGTVRPRGDHTARAAAQPEPGHCNHAHRAECGVFTGCQCSENDPIPIRAKRPTTDLAWPDMTQLLIPVPAAQMLLAQHGIAFHQVAAIRSKVTQLGNLPAIEADLYQTGPDGDRLYEYGKPVTEAVEIPLPVAGAPGQVARLG